MVYDVVWSLVHIWVLANLVWDMLQMASPLGDQSMKQKVTTTQLKLIQLTLAIIIFSLIGCGSDPVQEDLINYTNVEMKKFSALESKVIDTYASADGKIDANFLVLYNKTLKPTYTKFTNVIEDQVKPKTKEIQKLHELYIEIHNAQSAGFDLYASYVSSGGDENFYNQGNEKLNKSRKLTRQYETLFQELSKKHNVEVK